MLGTAPGGAGVVAVSPGEAAREVEAASACPTYSWSAAAGAEAYELAVFRVDGGEEPELLFTRRVEGSATSWSPSRAECLPAGGSYGWTVRPLVAAGRGEEAAWAEPLRFRVAGAPSEEEVAAALALLARWERTRSASATTSAGPADSPSAPPARPSRRASGRGELGGLEAPIASGVAAIRGENPDPSGSAFGIFGIGHSPAGAGVVARNESAGADLVLDGEANGATDSLLRQDSLDRPSANPESFDFRNSGAGALTLKVDGVDVVTTATDQDTLAALSCPDGQIAKRVSGSWQCANDDDTASTYTAGNQLQLSGNQFNVVEGPASGLDADTVDGLDSTALAAASHEHFGASWTGVGAALTLENLGTTGNLSSLVSRTYTETGAAVYGLHGHPSAAGYGLYGQSDSTLGTGVYGRAAQNGVTGAAWGSTGYGVTGLVMGANAVGTVGINHAPTGGATGVWGWIPSSPDGIGVAGLAQSPTGATIGVRGVVSSNGGTGVQGKATATSGATRGVYGETASNAQGIGVHGKAISTTGLNFGVVGEGPSPDTIGVYGLATATTGNPWGVYGESRSTATNGASPRATGVYGLASGASGDALGVAGGSASLAGAGVYGFNSGGGYAGYFQGAVHVNGNLSKAAGSFRIDHPLDPAGKYLSHSFVESPDMMNLYSGIVTLDGEGAAWVELPDWFEALNRDFRYQLTPIGAWSALWIGREIEGNRFQIRGGPHTRVSWQVTGVRHDAWAEAHRIPVEEAKPEEERGRYLHPELFGEPVEKSLFRPAPSAPGRTEAVFLGHSLAEAPTGDGGAPSPEAIADARGGDDGSR